MALTKITGTVITANAIANVAMANNTVTRSGHISNATIEIQHLGATANTRVLNDGIISNVNTVTANLNTLSCINLSSSFKLCMAGASCCCRIKTIN